MPTIALLVQYHGAPFNGFAKQKCSDVLTGIGTADAATVSGSVQSPLNIGSVAKGAPLRRSHPGCSPEPASSTSSGGSRKKRQIVTVQGELERALETLYRRPVATTCAGRTDAGVHARGQVVSFDVSEGESEQRTARTLLRSLNALTPETIGVRAVQQAPDGFSARFDAKSREYRYFISTASAPPLVMHDFCWHLRCADLDIDAMNAGASYLIGEHDFKSFCLLSSAIGKPTRRNLMRCEVAPVEVAGDELICLTVEGSSFLHSMVRTIAGTLAAVGRGLRDPGWVDEALAARDRKAAGEKAPASGLVFWGVAYESLRWADGA